MYFSGYSTILSLNKINIVSSGATNLQKLARDWHTTPELPLKSKGDPLLKEVAHA